MIQKKGGETLNNQNSYFIPAGLFIGLGIGLAIGHAASGLFIGFGGGLLLTAVFTWKKKND